jgi:hypothetical protein
MPEWSKPYPCRFGTHLVENRHDGRRTTHDDVPPVRRSEFATYRDRPVRNGSVSVEVGQISTDMVEAGPAHRMLLNSRSGTDMAEPPARLRVSRQPDVAL